MPIRRSWCLGSPVFIVLTLLTSLPPQNVPGAPAPKAKTYVLLYIPRQLSRSESSGFRRRQIAFFRAGTVPFVLYWAIRSLEKTDLPSLPKKGKGGKNNIDHDEDVAWLGQHLQVEYLDGTGVLRISLDAGSRREQALLVNAIAQAYFRLEADPSKQRDENCLKALKEMLRIHQAVATATQGESKEIHERAIVATKARITQMEAYLRAAPLLLELAEVPPD